jgi:exonuclease SbcC
MDAKVSSMPTEIIDIAKVRNKIFTKKSQTADLNAHMAELTLEKSQKNSKYEALCKFTESFAIDDLQEKKEKIDNAVESIDLLKSRLEAKQKEYKNCASKVELLHDHEYDPDCEYCAENKFVKDAELAKKRIPAIEAEIMHFEGSILAFEKEYAEMEPNKVHDHLKKYQQVLDKKVETSSRITEIGLELERDETTIKLLTKEIQELESEERVYVDNKEAIENLENILAEKNELENSLKSVKRSLAECEKERLAYYKQTGSIEEKIKNLEESRDQLEEYRSQYSAYDLYMQCMHSNGIAFDIIKKKLPIINEEIAKTIANIVDFNIFFEVDGNKIEIYIKHPKHDARPLEMGSGAEKTIAAMAIRMALLTVSSMPKGDIFILDEPGTALDEENMEGFIRMLELIKVNFKTVLLISHLDSLKDCVDMQIVIDKKDGYAHVKQ